ncbi:MAG: hypothetical protein NTX64_04455 [Elusimicrobia bacterium]|nr:hypothetical protein [Elusimicrobiota bacterium]
MRHVFSLAILIAAAPAWAGVAPGLEEAATLASGEASRVAGNLKARARGAPPQAPLSADLFEFTRAAGSRAVPDAGPLEEGALSCGTSRSKSDFYSIQKRAQHALAEGKPAAAASCFRRMLVAASPEGQLMADSWFTAALMGLGDAYAAAGDAARAVGFYEKGAGDNDPYGTGASAAVIVDAMRKILKLQPSHPVAKTLLAQGLARQALDKISEANFEFAETDVGDPAKGAGFVREALKLFAEADAVDKEPLARDAGIALARAKAQLRLGDDAAAAAALRDAAARFPQDKQIAEALQTTLGFQALWKALGSKAGAERSAELKAAVAALRRARELDPSDAEAATMLYRALQEIDPAQARRFNEDLCKTMMDHVLRERVYPAGPARIIEARGVVMLKPAGLPN